jgi:3-oxoadipate enol-lactonase
MQTETSSSGSVAEIGGYRIHYDVSGPANAPVLLLSNSLGTNYTMWDPQIPVLASRRRIVRYDTRGHGRSMVTPGPYSLAQLADDVAHLLGYLGISTVDYCGLSMGGLTGLQLALDHPALIRKLVVCSAAAKIGTAAMWDSRIAAVRASGTEPMAPSVMARWFTEEFRARQPAEVRRIEALLVATPAEGYAACCEAIRDADFRDAASAIRVPTLVLAGAVDPAVPTEEARWLANRIPNAQYSELPAAHLSNVEDAEGFTSHLSRFLDA